MYQYSLTELLGDSECNLSVKKSQIFIERNTYFTESLYLIFTISSRIITNNLYLIFRCKGLMILETYTSLKDDELQIKLPPFLNIDCEITGNPDYSMFNLSLVEDWNTSDKYCNAFKGQYSQQNVPEKCKISNYLMCRRLGYRSYVE